jgi:hypothetical protein
MAGVSEITLSELRLRHAQLARQASEVRVRWRTMPTGPGPRALAAGKRLRDLERRVRDYDRIITVIKNMDVDQVAEVINGG